MILRFLEPRALAAVTKSRSRRERNSARRIRAVPVQVEMLMATIIVPRVG